MSLPQLGVMTFDFVTLDPDLQSQLDIVDLSLLCLFTFEFALQFIYLGFTFIKNSWITFDFVSSPNMTYRTGIIIY
jgi:TRAP-type mannitol/chloroaromatic compound transport system permease small subunit